MEKIIIRRVSVSYEEDGEEKNETFDKSSTNWDEISEEISKSLTVNGSRSGLSKVKPQSEKNKSWLKILSEFYFVSGVVSL